MNKFKLNKLDQLISELDHGLKTLFTPPRSSFLSPAHNKNIPDLELTQTEIKKSASLMRVNHTGEVCAQALYRGQAFLAKNPETKFYLLEAAQEENNHLAWCQERLDNLNQAHTSYLNPFWYFSSWLIGFCAAKISDPISLGFVVETENQVIKHLSKHLLALPSADLKSREVLLQMKKDEAHHATNALSKGAAPLPQLIKKLMQAQSKIMTTTALFI